MKVKPLAKIIDREKENISSLVYLMKTNSAFSKYFSPQEGVNSEVSVVSKTVLTAIPQQSFREKKNNSKLMNTFFQI